MKTIKGIPIVNGIADSHIHILEKTVHEIVRDMIGDIADEIEIFHDARKKSIEATDKIRLNTLETIGESESMIFEAHIALLEDVELIEQVESYIKEEQCSASWALTEVGKSLVNMFEAMDNAYMRERAADIRDITERMINYVLGHEEDLDDIDEPYILLSHDLSPSETSSLNKVLVKGIITEVGGKTAHSAIIAKLLGIPYVVIQDGISILSEGQHVLLNGENGQVVIEPDESTSMAYAELYKQQQLLVSQYALLDGKPCITKDGVVVELLANIGQVSDMAYVIESEAKGVGLFRTEFIYMESEKLPTELEQTKIYETVLSGVKEGYVTIRTIDIGGDKDCPLFDIPKEDNPFLGYRGIRLCLQEQEIFKTQLRAILRASVSGNAKIMMPMIASISELVSAKAIIENCKAELDAENIPYDKDIPVGMMMETPAATIMADVFAKEVDFFSIGTNDLIQYTMATDRGNLKIADLYSPFDPAVLRSVKIIADAAHEAGIPISICGEAGADANLLPYWLGLGITKLSMSVATIPEVKWHISHLNTGVLEGVVIDVLKAKNKEEVRAVLVI